MSENFQFQGGGGGGCLSCGGGGGKISFSGGGTHNFAHTMSYALEHLLVAALVYSCGKKMKPFSYFFQYLSE